MLNVLTSERVRLLRRAKAGAVPIAELASGLNRDVRAVSRDVLAWKRRASCAPVIASIRVMDAARWSNL